MNICLQPTRVATNTDDIDGRLVFQDDLLVAVLVQLSEMHGEDAGRWFLEAGFGRAYHHAPPTFASLDEALAWIAQQLAVDRQ